MRKCFLFDIDGTMADLGHRRHYVAGPKKDWPSFFKDLDKDGPIEQTIFLNTILWQHFQRTIPIFITTGRSEDERDVTEDWLKKYDVHYVRMFMRKSGDYRADHIIKREILDDIRALGYEPWIIFDDRPQVVDMWRKEGLFVFQCDPNPSLTTHEAYLFHDTIKYPLSLMVGPSGAGKTTFLTSSGAYQRGEVISTDSLRENVCGDFKDQSQNARVHEVAHELAITRLKLGLPVILDATHCRRQDRVKAVGLVSPEIPVQYLVINRPMKNKMITGGWRHDVVFHDGRSLMEKHHQTFESQLKDILAGDGFPNVTVTDLRK